MDKIMKVVQIIGLILGVGSAVCTAAVGVHNTTKAVKEYEDLVEEEG